MHTLQTVSEEKEQTTVKLQEREKLARELEEEKQQLEEATSHLKAGLIVSVHYHTNVYMYYVVSCVGVLCFMFLLVDGRETERAGGGENRDRRTVSHNAWTHTQHTHAHTWRAHTYTNTRFLKCLLSPCVG